MRKPGIRQVDIIKWNFCIDHMLMVFDPENLDDIEYEAWS